MLRLFALTELSSASKSVITANFIFEDKSPFLNFVNQIWHCHSPGASLTNTVVLLRWASAAVWLSWNS
jgi:hypothetical protein